MKLLRVAEDVEDLGIPRLPAESQRVILLMETDQLPQEEHLHRTLQQLQPLLPAVILIGLKSGFADLGASHHMTYKCNDIHDSKSN